MRASSKILLASISLGSMLIPAKACMYRSLDLRDVLNADVVVEGSVVQYELVTTDEDRRRWKALLKNSSNQEQMEKIPFVSYARIRIEVSRNIFGQAPRHISAIWQSSMSIYPSKIDENSRIFVLRNAKKDAEQQQLALAGGVSSSTVEPDQFAVMHKSCAGPYIFSANDLPGRAIKQIFDGDGDPKIKAGILAKFIYMDGTGRF